MKNLLIALVLCLGSVGTQAAEWVEFSKTPDGITHNWKVGSEKNENGYTTAIISKKDTKNKNIVILKISVSDTNCKDEFGTFSVWDGYSNVNIQFAFGAGNVGATIAEAICYMGVAIKKTKGS